MKKFYLFVALLCIAITQSFSQNILGSHINYRALDSVTYELTVSIYTDCSVTGASAINDSVEVSWGSAGPSQRFMSKLNFVSSADVTGIGQNCVTQSRCASSAYAYGIQQNTYKDTVSVSSVNQCEITFAWFGNLRSSNITTGAASQGHYNYSTVNKCFNIKNTSTGLSDAPQFLLPVGQDFNSPGIPDTDIIPDSVTYRLVPCMAPAGSISVNPPWLPTKPITFLGFPNTNLNSPAGFYFDSLTGEMSFRPTVVNQVASYCVEVKEWRKISGVATLVGVQRYDLSWLVINTAINKTPTISGSNKAACTGNTVCIDIATNDIDAADSVKLAWKSNIPGATFTILDPTAKHPKAQVCWTPGVQHISSGPYTFTVTAKDNNCPHPGVALRTFSIFVHKTPDASDFAITSKTTQCNEASIQVNITNPLPGLVFEWMTADSLSSSSAVNPKLILYGAGWQKFYLQAKTPACNAQLITDSVFITPAYTLNVAAKNDTTACRNDSVTLFANPLNGTGPYEYVWKDLGNKATYNVAPPANWKFTVGVIDNNRCAAKRDINITVNQLPEIDAGVADTVCPQTPFQLSGARVSGNATPFKYEWAGIDTQRVVTTQLNQSRWFKLTATDQNGCKAIADSTYRLAFPLQLIAPADMKICYGASASLTAIASTDRQPLKYEWLNTSLTTENINVSPKKDSAFIIKVTDGNSCSLYDTVNITVFSQGSVTGTTDTGACPGEDVTLKVLYYNGASPVRFLWNNAPGADSLRVTANSSRNVVLAMKDNNNCLAFDTIFVAAYQLPKAIAGPDMSVCHNTPITINSIAAGGKAPHSYQWSHGPATSSISAVISSPVNYVLKVTDANGCVGYDTLKLGVYPRDRAIINPLPVLCDNGSPTQLYAIPQTGTWSGTAMSGNKFSPATAGAGNHALLYSVTNTHGCTNIDTVIATVHSSPKPDFITNRDTGTVPFTVDFTNTTPTSTTSWKWVVKNYYGNIVFTSSAQNPTFTFKDAATYDVTLTVGDGNCEGQIVKTSRIQAFNPKNTTGIGEVAKNYRVYPNPASGYLYIDGENISALQLNDVQGRLVDIAAQHISGEKYMLDISLLAGGVYFITITDSDNHIFNEKIIINK